MLHLTFCRNASGAACDSEVRELARHIENKGLLNAIDLVTITDFALPDEWLGYDRRPENIIIDALRRLVG